MPVKSWRGRFLLIRNAKRYICVKDAIIYDLWCYCEMAPKNKENNKRKKQIEDEADEDYRKRRDRNNQAVKRSRVKSKLRTQQTLERVNQLKTENELLEEKIKMLTKELGFLKDLFIAHAGGSSQHSINIQDLDLNALLSEEKPTEDLLKTTTTKL